MNKLLTGNEIILEAALKAGAEAFFGYPITPTTEILTGWAQKAAENKNLIFLQTEDEPAAGFGVLGAALAGKKAWTATAAAGHILMQDPLMVAEAERIPFVMYVGQRGGPSTGTVIYSQQELNLATTGGNGEAFRIVLAPSNLQELYEYTIRAFDMAWRYRLPVIILGDGYLSKMTGEVEFKKPKSLAPARPTLQSSISPVNLRNCYSTEEELGAVLEKETRDFERISKEVEISETVTCADAAVVIYAWGSVAEAAKEAVKKMRVEGFRVGLFRPITMRPFSYERAKAAANHSKKVLVVESASGQFARLIKESLFGADVTIKNFVKPAEGITAEEIEEAVKEVLNG